MIGYKAFHKKGKQLFCMPFPKKWKVYKVGETYEEDNIKICSRGFHFCRELKDCLDYYPLLETTAICEIEAQGDIVDGKRGKSVCSKITIIRKLTKQEIRSALDDYNKNKKHKNENKNCIYDSNGVINSYYISSSRYINKSHSVVFSKYINKSLCIKDSLNINSSKVILDSGNIVSGNVIFKGINIERSSVIQNGTYIKESDTVSDSKQVFMSSLVKSSYGVAYSYLVENSVGIYRSSNISSSKYITQCNNISNCLFCYGISCKEYMIFNKPVSKEYFQEVLDNIQEEYDMWIPKFIKYNELLQLRRQKLELAYNNFIDSDLFGYIKPLKEFNKELFNKITIE